MRTTVTLEPDVEALLKRRMREQGVSFKQAVNEAVRAAFGSADNRTGPFTTPSNMGQPLVNLDKALQLAGELEDEERIDKMREGR